MREPTNRERIIDDLKAATGALGDLSGPERSTQRGVRTTAGIARSALMAVFDQLDGADKPQAVDYPSPGEFRSRMDPKGMTTVVWLDKVNINMPFALVIQMLKVMTRLIRYSFQITSGII